MAFSTTNIQTVSLGGNRRMTSGDWSCNLADASGTVGVSGGKLYGFQFLGNQTGSQVQVVKAVPSQSGAVVTLTVYPAEAVTSGTFFVIHA